jgi:L-arabinose transport system ATP-binding protein
MIEILRALRGNLKVLALDEPTSSLSEADADDLFALIAALKAQGVALIYVSHRMKEILRLADRVSVLRDGALVGTRPARDLDDATLIRMMVGRPLSDVMKRRRNATETPVLRVAGLTSSKVSDIDITVRKGEVVGLAGLIGAGRTELAKTIFGAFPHDAGRIEIDGRAVDIRSPRDAIDAGIAYAPEERKADALLLERSVGENVSLAILRRLTRFRLIDQRRETGIVADFVQRLRVKTPSLAQPVGKLSGGNQQKVVLARWLASGPKLLILDEPTRGIDVGAKSEIYALIEALAHDGLGILLISSELPEILGLSDRIVCMQHGRITGELDGATATEEAVLHLCMASDVAPTAVLSPAGRLSH